MKRCPQCEFIYEDDQSLCDMDGVLLVFDSRSLPNLRAFAAVDVPVAPKAHWRHRTFPAMAAIILASVFSLVYFVSTQRTAPVTVPVPVDGGSATTPAESSPSDAQQTPPSPAAPEMTGAAVTAKEETKPEAAKTTVSPAAKKANAKTPTTERKPDEPQKEDSKVGSILKKTGRILKKPFKL